MTQFNLDTMIMKTAFTHAKYSTASKLKVGCIIVKDGKSISSGINGTFTGSKTNICEEIEYTDKNWFKLTTNKSVVHAEQNAIFAAAKAGISLDGTTLYCTHFPCEACQLAIIQSGIKEVVFYHIYKEERFNFLKEAGITVRQVRQVNIEE